MSNHTTTLSSEQHVHVPLHDKHHYDYSIGTSSGSQETSAPSPSYTINDTFSQRQLDSDVKHTATEVQADVAFADSPSQLPFDDLIGGSLRRPSLPVTTHQDLLESSSSTLRLENQRNSNQQAKNPNTSKVPRQQSTDFRQPPQRPELPHSSSSAPDTRKLLEKISELEVDPFGESPFEAARRAQRAGDQDVIKSPSLSGQAYVNGRFPSIKPGEIMPSKLLRLINGPPSFFPPLEAPPFPPTVHSPIRPAHFPPSFHPLSSPSEPARTSSQHQPPSQHMSQLPRSHSYRRPPSPSRPAASVPSNPAPAHSHGPPPDLLRSRSQSVIPPTTPPHPTRSHSHQNALPLNPSQYEEYANAPPPSPRHTLNPRECVPPGLVPTGRYSVAQPSPPVPHPSPPPLQRPPVPPSQAQFQHHSPGPPSQYHHPTPPRSALRDPRRQSLPTPPPSQVLFEPRGPSPVRLPSQNVPTPQALGSVRSPPMRSGSPRPDNSRPPRVTPKPVMPQLLAPLEPNLSRDGGASQLQRSMSSSAIGAQKGGFLAKTKSILRKRSSATGIKTHGDGAISFAPTMPNLMEEDAIESKKLGKRLSRKK